MSRGIVVGSDQTQEWLLPWWWKNYRSQSGYPVAFIDLGMSQEAKGWCQERGQLIALDAPSDFVLPSAFVDKELAAAWERTFGPSVWRLREQWLKKPLAMLQSPFEESLWLDLDCEIVGPLAPLFSAIHACSKMALCPERNVYLEETTYNTGVVAFDKTSPLLARWAEVCIQNNNKFLSDREALSDLINYENIEVSELAESYNWRFEYGVHLAAAILHWSGAWGKSVIRRSSQLQHFTPP